MCERVLRRWTNFKSLRILWPSKADSRAPRVGQNRLQIVVRTETLKAPRLSAWKAVRGLDLHSVPTLLPPDILGWL